MFLKLGSRLKKGTVMIWNMVTLICLYVAYLHFQEHFYDIKQYNVFQMGS